MGNEISMKISIRLNVLKTTVKAMNINRYSNALQNGFLHTISAIKIITNVGSEWIRKPRIFSQIEAFMLNTSNEKIIIKKANRNVSTLGNQNSTVFIAPIFQKVSE